VIQLMYGLDFREYIIVPDGNYFINPTESEGNLNYWKTGGFVQATKTLFNDKVKINTVLRVEKNQYFDPKLNPRLAVVYTPAPNHTLRVSAQNGFRFPSIFEAFSNINSGGRKRVGGLPVMSDGVFENSYTQASITQFQRAVQTDVNTNGMTVGNAIVKNQNLLRKNPYDYLEPEQVTSFEAGYRSSLLDGKLNVDLDVYYNIYRNLIAQIDANVPRTQKADSIAFYLQQNSRQDLYRLWTNSKTVSHNYGATVGMNYALTGKIKVGGNFTFAKLGHRDQSDGLEDGFNTPRWIYNLFISSPAIYKTLGFNVNFRQQSEFLWQSALATGNVAGYATVDLQLSAGFIKNALTVKVGATNLLNQYYYSFIGGPGIGGFYYTSLTYGF
jgi:outer membrane receptor protein involved in Fe transport